MISSTQLGQTNGAVRVLSAYDHQRRRVRKTVQRLSLPDAAPPMPPPPGEWTTTETHTYFYDDWNLIEERIARADGTASTNRYVWGKDLSGSLQGAGGVGGLLAVIHDSVPYFSCYDHNGNVTRYLDATGATVAAYAYDAFGRTLSATGPLATTFHHRFSTKYFDPETGLYYYGYRFYSPSLMRWLNRDPIEENGGVNLYSLVFNNPIANTDSLGNHRYITQFDVENIFGTGGTQIHVGVAVDEWKCIGGIWECVGIVTFDFIPKKVPFLYLRASAWTVPGMIIERSGLQLNAPIAIFSTVHQDIAMIDQIRKEAQAPPSYNALFFNCIIWSERAIRYGL